MLRKIVVILMPLALLCLFVSCGDELIETCDDGCAGSGACADHDGADCTEGPSDDGYVICTDGFIDKDYLYQCGNTCDTSCDDDTTDDTTDDEVTETCDDGCADSGACADHEGVDCSAGPDSDGSVICLDGWADSTVLYDCSIGNTTSF